MTNIEFFALEVLEHLNEHPETEFKYGELFTELKIPEKYHNEVFNHLWHHSPQFISGKGGFPGKKNALIKINARGIDYITDYTSKKRIEEKANFIKYLDEALRYLTQDDNVRKYAVVDLHRAIQTTTKTVVDILNKLKSRAFIELSHTNRSFDFIYVLEPAFAFAIDKSFADEKKTQEQKTSVNKIEMRDGIAFMGDHSGDLSYLKTSAMPKTTPTKPDTRHGIMTSIGIFIMKHIWPFVLAVAAAVLAGYILWRLHWLGN